MSFVTTQPQMLTAVASDLQAIDSALSARNAAAAGPTTGVVPVAADEVSALTAEQFAAHARIYQAVSAQAVAVHDMFVASLAASADSYAATEAANTIAGELNPVPQWISQTAVTRRPAARKPAAAQRPALGQLVTGQRVHRVSAERVSPARLTKAHISRRGVRQSTGTNAA
jgi:PE family